MLEVQGLNDALVKNSFEGTHTGDAEGVTIQTQISLLKTGPYPRRVRERLLNEPVQSSSQQQGLIADLRHRLHKEDLDALGASRAATDMAFETFDARPINGTRLIELSCDSRSPEMAAQFINTMANEFVEDTTRDRMQSSQRTIEWLTSQIEETKLKLGEAQTRLQDFVKKSGSLFAEPDSTLDDTKLRQLQGELASAQSDRITKQTRYEMAMRDPAALAEMVGNPDLQSLQTRISSLQQERASLSLTLTADHPKIQKLQAQIGLLQTQYQQQANLVVDRLKNDVDAAQKREGLLNQAHGSQSKQVTSLQSKASEFNGMRREVDVLQQIYQSLLQQANQAAMNNSVPVTPIRLVEAAAPPPLPYSPVPALYIGFGIVAGVFVTGGLAFVLEKSDRSVKTSNGVRRVVNAPNLGTIPSVTALNAAFAPTLRQRFQRRSSPSKRPMLPVVGGSPTVPAIWRNSLSPMAESFRSVLASLMRARSGGERAHTIMVTSPGPAEGKTTIISNLAVALSETGQRVVVVDADFRCPNLHSMFSENNDRGLTDILLETTPIAEYGLAELVRPTDFPRVSIVPNRTSSENISQLLYLPRLRELLKRLRTEFDTVLIDVPPVLLVADARIIGPLTGGVILVIRAGSTEHNSAADAMERLAADNLPLIGSVLNDWKPAKSRFRESYYYHKA